MLLTLLEPVRAQFEIMARKRLLFEALRKKKDGRRPVIPRKKIDKKEIGKVPVVQQSNWHNY